jgi:hypothetical protein
MSYDPCMLMNDTFARHGDKKGSKSEREGDETRNPPPFAYIPRLLLRHPAILSERIIVAPSHV